MRVKGDSRLAVQHLRNPYDAGPAALQFLDYALQFSL